MNFFIFEIKIKKKKRLGGISKDIALNTIYMYMYYINIGNNLVYKLGLLYLLHQGNVQ